MVWPCLEKIGSQGTDVAGIHSLRVNISKSAGNINLLVFHQSKGSLLIGIAGALRYLSISPMEHANEFSDISKVSTFLLNFVHTANAVFGTSFTLSDSTSF